MGQNGLRPIWCFVFYLITFRVLRFCLHAFIYYAWPDTGVLWLQAAVELGLAIVAILPAVAMSRIEHRPFGIYGLPLRQAFGKLFWYGALWGFGSITICCCLPCTELMPLTSGSFALHGSARVQVCRVLGSVLSDRGFLRRILHSWLYPVHPDSFGWVSGRPRSCCRQVSACFIWEIREKAGLAFWARFSSAFSFV